MSTVAKYRNLTKKMREVLEKIPKKTNSMDVTRTIVSLLSTVYPEETDFSNQKYIPLVILGSLTSALNYWYHFSQSGLRIDTTSNAKETIGEHFLRLLYLRKPTDLEIKTM